MNAEQYSELTVQQLKDRLREFGQPTAGAKAELISRILCIKATGENSVSIAEDMQNSTATEVPGINKRETELICRQMEMARRERDAKRIGNSALRN
ncbi:hypothetical protein KPH14_010927 [Odynerus spinipes]|uniref:SAP domain-containing protein n=1 Tax=Odynerus spinipes TaxID=1348599 RepID=A0AAD9VLL3_9HYME|nr:hypothetical protein KPH14_010927 [Odynerus spinipes]